MMKKKKNKICYLCGKIADTTEHVPPKGLFPEPRSSDLITVPSCEKHNRTYSKDDEYFIWFITEASSYSPSAQHVIENKIVKAFKRSPKYHKMIMSGLTNVEIMTKGGIYIKTVKAFKYNVSRVQRVINKIIRGLYYFIKSYKAIYPTGYHVRKFYLVDLWSIEKNLTEFIKNAPGKDVANGNFGFKYRYANEDNYLMMWFLLFFKRTLIIALTDKRKNPVWKLKDIEE